VPSISDTAALEQAIGLAQRGELEAALAALSDLVERNPKLGRAWNGLGVVQMQLGHVRDAESSLLRAEQEAPGDFRSQLNLGKLYNALNRPAEAEARLRQAMLLAPDSADSHFGLAALLRDTGRHAEAESCLRRVIELSPQDAEAHHLLAQVLIETGRSPQAEFCLREAIRLRPDFGLAYNDLAPLLLETDRLPEAQAACREATRLAPGLLSAWSSYAMFGQYDPDVGDAELLARARAAGDAALRSVRRYATPLPRTTQASANLRLGFVSGDLHQHPVGHFLLPLLQELGRLGVAAALYSNGTVVDQVSRQLAELGQWTDIARETDELAWTRIRHDAPDVLIDLAGHTGNNRLALFAARAARVQVSWLGYFATTGTPNMDYVLMDPWHAPKGAEAQFTEHVLRMPHTRFCFQPVDMAPSVAHREADARHIVFGSFNNVAKISDPVVQAWSRILHGVPGSRLVLKWRTLRLPACREALAARFGRAGLGPERVEFRPDSSYDVLLGEYRDVDIALDTFPFTGGRTSFDAMWMGVPVVTRTGDRPVSRQTLCLLGNVGLVDLAADTEDGFVERAVGLARDVARLGELRATLRQRMQASPLMDAPGFARAFVNILRDAANGVV
jgi:protein O-GlcNAc transferase